MHRAVQSAVLHGAFVGYELEVSVHVFVSVGFGQT